MSKLLMGALVVLTMGVFSSCKDYDDDINATNSRIDKVVSDLQDQVEALKAAQITCNNNFTTAKNAADAAQATADKALEDLAKAQAALEAAIAAGDKAAQEAAQKMVDAAKAEAMEYAAKVAKEEATAAAEKAKAEAIDRIIEEVNAIKAAYVSNETFNKELEKLATVEGLNAAIKKAADELAELKTIMEAADKGIYDKITEVQNALQAAIDKKVEQKDIDAAIAIVTAQITGLSNTLDEKVATLTAKDTELANLIQANTTNISANAAAIATLQQQILQVEVNKQAIEALQAKTNNLESQLTSANEAISANAAAIATLQTGLAAANDAIAEQTTKLANFITEINAKVDANTGRIANNEAAITTLNGIVSDLQDQINNINTDIIALATDLANYKTEANGRLSTLDTNVAKNAEDIAALLVRMTAAETEVAKIAGILSSIETINNDIQNLQAADVVLNEAIEALKTQLSEKVQELNEAIATANQKIADNAAAIGVNAANIALNLEKIQANASNIATLQGQVSTLNTQLGQVRDRVTAAEKKLNVLTLFVNKNLTSIVTKPNSWIYGFPRVDATVIKAQDTYTFPTTFNATAGDAATKQAAAGYSFAVTANYWMNPSTFDKDLYDYKFAELPRQNTITRGNRDDKTAGTTIEKTTYSNGVLSVQFRFNVAENVNDAVTIKTDNESTPQFMRTETESYAWVTTMALQATRKANADEQAAGLDKNRMVTSDYAVFVPQYLEDLLLGNSYFKSDLHQEGNQKGHLNSGIATPTAGKSGYQKTKDEDARGVYSFSVQRNRKIADGEIKAYGDTQHGYLNLDNVVTVHYVENGDEKVWTNKQAREIGFEFKYTMLDNANLFNQTSSEGTDHKNIISLNDEGAKATSAGKALIIRVELVANNKTYAYGYVSLLITNITATATKNFGTLTLNCTNSGTENFVVKTAWDPFIKMVADSAGLTPAILTAKNPDNTDKYYTLVADGTGFQKYTESTFVTTTTQHGVIAHQGTNLQWSFDLAQAKGAFYDTNDNPLNINKKNPYYRWLRFQPTTAGKNQGYVDIAIKVVIDSIGYPYGSYSKDNRIQQMWFTANSATIAPSKDNRDEIHANVETLEQTLGFTGKLTAKADDEFVFDMTSFFVGNKFAIKPGTGFSFSEMADVFFDASKYYVKSTNKFGSDCYATGADGTEYILWLNTITDKELKASPVIGGAFKTDAYDATSNPNGYQVVVTLSGTHNEIATFMGYPRLADGSANPNAAKYTYARNLLNHADHAKLGKGETFTTHMIQHQFNNCLPIDESGDQAFDVRYLRPVSGIANDEYIVYDAQNTGNKIYLADLVNFIDWRNHKFAANWNAATMKSKNSAYNLAGDFTGMDYLNYYGVTTIFADFSQVKTNINGGDLADKDNWPALGNITNKMQFTPDAKALAGNGSAVSATRTYADFRTDNGYYTYENNAGGVGDFYLYLPIQIKYDWGLTQAEWILIKVVKTQGQQNQARQN